MLDRLAVRFDPAAAYPEVGALRTALAGGDWAGARARLDALPPVDRTVLLRLLSPSFSGPSVPADHTAAALLGFHRIEAAWAIRGGYGAEYTSRKRFAGFHDGLRVAERALTEAVGITPDDPALWVARLKSARGLELGIAETRRRYARLAEIDPHHLPGQSQLVQQLCPKWSGSWPEVLAFAREAMLAAPVGGPHGVLVAEAHLERWLALAEGDARAGYRYLASAAVSAEIDEAARRSVFHPGFGRTVGWVGVLSTFAVVFSLRRDHRSAAAAFTALGPLATEHPWNYLGDPAVAVRKYRALALSPGAGALTATAGALSATGRFVRRAAAVLAATGGLR